MCCSWIIFLNFACCSDCCGAGKEQRKLFQGAGRMAGVARLSAAYVIFTSLV